MSLKDELDMKKVKILELETENGEMRTIIEQLNKEVKTLKEESGKKKVAEAVTAELD